MNCHKRTSFKGHQRVITAKVLGVMEHLGETYALIATRQGYEVICTMVGSWVIQLGNDCSGWQEKTRQFLDSTGEERVADAAIARLQYNHTFGLIVRAGVWR